ncbi:MAG: DHA2 family efflux MFS transporter permease subunit [Hydrogenobacter thermophilus]|uniref:DHA2 family efflux MFS transporter permease subunit n=1 Tax=Hydrogenobacter thermophilus TaxID=940 RepID=UPI001C75F494|nr:DHA2 family efflux MFS transporter permease subunit [Hydrogenobacter thermophilus]QWK19438.1 MAG: DHA2 family efflux MFS transporter permease subunit [Hydrogenobacter thermophilus]
MQERPLYELVSPFERVMLTLSLMMGVFMAILDTTIVDIVVPKMMAPLSTDLYGVQWVITSYMMAAASGILLVESLERYVGLRNVFISGLFLFTVASFLSGQAPSLDWMIASRSLQGFGEALIVVSAEALLFSAYPPEKRGLAMGIYGLGVSFAPALGPTLGGYITEYINWRWVFYINLPVGIINLVLALSFLPNYKPQNAHGRLNLVSFLFLSSATVFLLITLSKGQQYGWWNSDFILYTSLVSLFSFLLFFLSELASKEPLIDYSIFSIREFVVAILVYYLLLGFSMYQVFYLIPLYYENLKGIDTLMTGIHILPLALAIGFSSPIAGVLGDKKGEILSLSIAVLTYLYAVLFVMPQFNYFTPAWESSLKMILLGIGMGFFFAPITNLALKKLGEKTTLGVSLMHYIRFVGGSFGTAIATNDLQRFMWESFQKTSEVQSYNAVNQYLLSLFHLGEERAKAFFYGIEQLYAYSNAFESTFFGAGLWGLLGSLPIFYLLLTYLIRRARAWSGSTPS